MKRIFYISDAKSIHTRRWVEHYRDQGIQVHLASFRFENIEGVHVHLFESATYLPCLHFVGSSSEFSLM